MRTYMRRALAAFLGAGLCASVASPLAWAAVRRPTHAMPGVPVARVTAQTSSGEVVSGSSVTVALGAANTNVAKEKAPRITFSLSKDIMKATTPAARLFQRFYNQGGTIYHNDRTPKDPTKPTRSDAPAGLYYAAIASLCQKDYVVRVKKKPNYLGIPAALDGMNAVDMATLRTWLRALYPKAAVGDLSTLIGNYPGVEEETPLDEMGAIDCVIEDIYALDDDTFIVSAMAYYGELRRFGYDIGIERTKSGWVVHFFDLKWSA